MARVRKARSGERRFQRASCCFPGTFNWGTVSHPATIMIIGLGGGFVSSEVQVPEGCDVSLSFEMDPEREPVRARGKVAWLTRKGIRIRDMPRRQGFAVEFTRIFPEHKARIDEYVKNQNRLFKAIDHEMKKKKPDKKLIKKLFSQARPGESTHLNHIKKVTKDELRHFRLRKYPQEDE